MKTEVDLFEQKQIISAIPVEMWIWDRLVTNERYSVVVVSKPEFLELRGLKVQTEKWRLCDTRLRILVRTEMPGGQGTPGEKVARNTEADVPADKVRGEAGRCTGHPRWSDVRLHSEKNHRKNNCDIIGRLLTCVCVCVFSTVMVSQSILSCNF